MARKQVVVIDRDAIADAFLEVLEETQDASAVNFREIARRLNCNHTNLYNYFENFDDIRVAALCRLSEKLKSLLVPAYEADNPSEKLRHIVQSIVRFAVANPGLYRFLWVDSIGKEKRNALVGKLARPENIIVSLLEQMRTKKMSADEIDTVAAIVHSFVHGEILKRICGRYQVLGEPFSDENIANNALCLAKSLLGA